MHRSLTQGTYPVRELNAGPASKTTLPVSFKTDKCLYGDYRLGPFWDPGGNYPSPDTATTIEFNAPRNGRCYTEHGITFGVDTEPLEPGQAYRLTLRLEDPERWVPGPGRHQRRRYQATPGPSIVEIGFGFGAVADTMHRMAGPTNTERVFMAQGITSLVPIWGFYLVAVVWYVDVLELSAFRLIMLGTALEASLLISEIPTGVVADRFSRKWSVVLSFLLTGVSMVLHPISTNFAVLLATQVLFGFGWSFRSGADVAWFTAESDDPEQVAQAIVRRQRWVLIVAAVSMPLVVLVGLWSLRATIALTGVVTLLAGLWLAFAMTDSRAKRVDTDPSAGEIFRDGLALCRRVPTIRRLLVIMLLAGLGSEAIDRLGFQRFIEEGDFSDNSLVFTGALFVVLAFGGAMTVAVAEARLGRGVRFALVVAGLLALASLGAAVVALAPILGIAIGMLLQDTTRETLDPVAMAWANTETEEASRATVHSFLSQAGGIGQVVGGFMAAGIATVVGASPALLVSAALFGLAASWAATTNSQPAEVRSSTNTKADA